MDTKTIIQRLGGTTAVSRICGITAASVSEWMQPGRGIPQAREQYLRLLRPEAFKPARKPHR